MLLSIQVHRFIILLVIAGDDVCEPICTLKVPVDGSVDTFLEAYRWLPVKLSYYLACVDSVSPVVSGPVGYVLYQRFRFAQMVEYQIDDFQIRFRAKVSGSREDANVDNVVLLMNARTGALGQLEGYINARILVEALNRAGPNLTRQGFIDAIESISGYQIGPAIAISFSHSNHQGMERVYFTKLEGDRFVLVNDWGLVKTDFETARQDGSPPPQHGQGA